MMVVYLGGCNKMQEVIEVLKRKTIQLSRNNVQVVDESPDKGEDMMNILKFVYK